MKTWNGVAAEKSSAPVRLDLLSEEELAEWVGPVQRLAREAEEVYAMFNVNRDDQAPRAAAIYRRLLDEAGVSATGGGTAAGAADAVLIGFDTSVTCA